LILIGNLGSDPELWHTAAGTPVCSFRMAVNKKYTTTDGEQREKSTWFRVTVWKNLAELVNKYLTKGSQVFVLGEIEDPSMYTNRAGEPAASLEVTSHLVKFLSTRNPAGVELDRMTDAEKQEARNPNVRRQLSDSDIPF